MKFTVDELLKYNSKVPKPRQLYDVITPINVKITVDDDKWIKSTKVLVSPIIQHEILVSKENAWKPTKETNDLKKMNGIVNKLTADNFEKLCLEAKTLNYKHPEIVEMIFKKAVEMPKYGSVYADFCESLSLHDLITDLCLDQFKKFKHKNLSMFIGQLYKKNIIFSVEVFVDDLLNDLDISNVEILIELIKTIGPRNAEFKDVINHLESVKTNYDDNDETKRIEYIIDHLIKLSQ